MNSTTHWLILALALWASSATWASIPTAGTSDQPDHAQLSLSGEWAFVWNRWTGPAEIVNENFQFEIVTLPNYLSSLVSWSENDSINAEGIATYVKQITGLPSRFDRPAINMRSVNDAWEAYWVSPNGSAKFLGGSGVIAQSRETEVVNDQTYILELPNTEVEGYLMIYTSSFHYARSGLYGDFVVEEQEHVLRGILIDLASRAFLIGIGLYVVVQNLVFFVQRPKEKTLLLLAVFGFIGLARSSFASSYIDYFVIAPSFTSLSVKFEYILVVWPGVAGLHLVLNLFPISYGKRIAISSYLFLFALIFYTLWQTDSMITHQLRLYQYSLLVFTAVSFLVIANGILSKMPDSNYFLRSFIPLIVAVFNDIIAANSPSYSFYMAEYALFLFLFLQTQIQASRFVSALDTAEHLTQNLKAEVDKKTAELSHRNELLEEKAQHLQEKHNEVKLLSEIDHLTGLYNRQSLESHSNVLFQLALSFKQPLTAVMMDLDHFKELNDQFGHGVGDECLVFVASYLRGLNLRKRDLIARYGGEEFTLVLTDTSVDAAQEIVQAICDGLNAVPIQGDHDDIYLTASFGIADIELTQAKEMKELIQCADQALYAAKQNGRNRVERANGSTTFEL